MIPTLHLAEPLEEGYHFRKLSVREGQGIYRFLLQRDVIYIHARAVLPLFGAVSFRDRSGREWMRMTTRTQILRAGYAWNGNSPKRGITLLGRDLWLGTPDFHPGTLAASLKHDADFQFHHTAHHPFSLEETNLHYLHLCQNDHFRLDGIYHSALRNFSASAWNSPLAPGLHSVQLR